VLHADGHAAVVEHAAQVVAQGEGFLADALREDVGCVVEVGELGVGFCGGGGAGVEDFGAEFGAGGAEEVGFLGEGGLVFGCEGEEWICGGWEVETDVFDV